MTTSAMTATTSRHRTSELARAQARTGYLFVLPTASLYLAFVLAPNYDLVLGIARSRSSVRSEFRDWVDNNSLPIEQSTFFARTPAW